MKKRLAIILLIVAASCAAVFLAPKHNRKDISDTFKFAYEMVYDSEIVYRWECWWYNVPKPTFQSMPTTKSIE